MKGGYFFDESVFFPCGGAARDSPPDRRVGPGDRSVRSLTGTSMLMALSVLLNQFTIFISALIRVSFTFLPIAAAGMLFGPVLTGLAGAGHRHSQVLHPQRRKRLLPRVHDQ